MVLTRAQKKNTLSQDKSPKEKSPKNQLVQISVMKISVMKWRKYVQVKQKESSPLSMLMWLWSPMLFTPFYPKRKVELEKADGAAENQDDKLPDDKLPVVWAFMERFMYSKLFFFMAVVVTIAYLSLFLSYAGVLYLIEVDAWCRCMLISTVSLPERGLLWELAEGLLMWTITKPTFLFGTGGLFHGNQATLFRAMHSMGSVTPFAGGIAVYSHDTVSAALLNMTQHGGQFLNAYPVSEQCRTYTRIMFSNTSERHNQIRRIYSLHLNGSDLSAHNHSLLPDPDKPIIFHGSGDSATLVRIRRLVARNVWFRVFQVCPGESLERNLANYIEIGDNCRLGPLSGHFLGSIDSIRRTAVKAASETAVGMAIKDYARTGELRQTEANDLLCALVDEILHGIFSTSHLAVSALDRIQSDPARYLKLWRANPPAFLIESARLDPAVASVTTVLLQDQIFTVSTGKSNIDQPMKLHKGSTVQLVISEANTDPAVFGGPGRSVARSRDFDIDRSPEEVASILSWNGPLSSVVSGKAPMGCPGYQLSLEVSRHIVDRFEKIDVDEVDTATHTQESRKNNRERHQPAITFLNEEVALGLWGSACVVAAFYVTSYFGWGVIIRVYVRFLVFQALWAFATFFDLEWMADHCIVQIGAAGHRTAVIVAQYRWDHLKPQDGDIAEVKNLEDLLPPGILDNAVFFSTCSVHAIILYLQATREIFFLQHTEPYNWHNDVSLGLDSWLAGRSAPGGFLYFVAHVISGYATTKVAIVYCISAMLVSVKSLYYFYSTEQDATSKWDMSLGLFSVIAALVNVVWPHFHFKFGPLVRSLADVLLFAPWITQAVISVNNRVQRRATVKVPLKTWKSLLLSWSKWTTLKTVTVVVIGLLMLGHSKLYSSKICIDKDFAKHTILCSEGENYLRDVDPHTKIVYQLIHTFTNTRETREPEVLPPVYRYDHHEMVKLPCNIDVPSWDEDFPSAERLKMAIFDFLRWEFFHPSGDLDKVFPVPSRAADVLDAAVGEDLKPLELSQYSTLSTDPALEQFAFYGLAAHTIERIDPENESNIVYISNFSWMSVLEVRPDFEPYGATAFFDRRGKVLKIFWDYGKKDVFPGDTDWNHTKWVYKCSVLVSVTVKDHLVGIHFMASNFLSTSAVRNLDPDHNIRRLLKPHTFGAASINKAATLTLVSENSFVHRATALTTDAMKVALNFSVHSTSYLTTNQHLAKTKMADASEDLYPWGHDLVKFTAVVKKFVKAYIYVYYPDDTTIAADTELAEFWHDLWMDPTAPIAKSILTRDRVVNTLTCFIVYVTGIHNHVGNVADYIKDPLLLSGKIRPDREEADVQSTFQVLNIGLTTAKKMPRLVSDFTHVLKRDSNLPKTTAIFHEFQKDLEALSVEIEGKNKKKRKHPCNSFNPKMMVSSVSI